ncbi:MAG: SLC13 family permease, partial [Methanobacteriota archaeon]
MDEALKLITLLIFASCYGLAISRKFKLAYIGLLSAFLVLALLLPTNALTPQQALNSVKWDVLGIYWGFMMLSIIFSESGVPKHLARHILHRTRNEGVALLALCGITAFLSSFLENVGVILIMAPIAIEVSRKTKSS